MIKLHGEDVRVNTGYAYAAFHRRWPTYNEPLVELVHQARVTTDRGIVVVDVGAAVGDTVLLLMERCPGDVAKFICIEGEPEFFDYLSVNLGHRSGTELHHVMLSDAPGTEHALVRTHSGTASAQGVAAQSTTTLDSLLGDSAHVDVLKIDTDGFDGKVLAGAHRVLGGSRPAVVFEWHPGLCKATGQSHTLAFETLVAQGYRRFIWFTKVGEFSHVTEGYDTSTTELLADLCIAGSGPLPDWHYDVVALHDTSPIDALAVASLRHARQSRRSER